MDILLMSQNTTQTQAFKLKGRLYTFAVLQILDTDVNLFTEQLIDTVSRAPKLFDRTPVVFDLSAVYQLNFDLHAFLEVARLHGMIPVAIQGGGAFLDTLAQSQGIAVLHASSTQDKPIIERPIEPTSVEPTKTKLLTTPVRSGQQFVAKGSDLIVTSSVSHGAELLADGSIHVYGVLRGRALAGISGDKDVRIFCQSLDAELVAIAGHYWLSEDLQDLQQTPTNGSVQIFLEQERLQIKPLT
jgi:septum site-determining protein MinC